MSGLQGAAVIKRKHSVGADNGGPQSGQNPRVRFQVEERPEKRRLVIPDDFTLVRQSCVVNPGAVASGQQELWLIQLPNLAALQNLAATGSIEVDSSILRSVGLSSASIGSLPSFQCHDGLSYKLVPEVNTVAKQLITICPMENEEGEAQAISVSRRLTLVRDLVPPETGSTAGEPEDVQAALARLDASLAAMGVARREVAAANATEGAMEVDRSGGKKPSNKDLQKEERSGKRSGKEGEGVETTHKEKHKDKSKEKDKKKDKDKDKHEKSKLAQTPGVVPALKGTGIKQPPATAPPAMRPPAAAETPATALTAVEATPAGAASTGKKDKHKDKKHKDKDKRDKDKKHKDKDKKKKDKKKKDKKEKDKDKKGVKKDSSSETDSDSD
ncbi:hypothetical protein Vafri_8815 [Volvox africanus]|uniref:Uncharacterized protein n=1 Tax=Volvox africanus TaxID=51714 RepID=A0A8J4EZD2_9CHLO|nr:hypothetical protein Vafri_8815 [Volvox africanus]